MPQVKKNLILKKTFSYTHGSATLPFTLDMNDKEGMKSFKKCLIEALKDVEKEINGNS